MENRKLEELEFSSVEPMLSRMADSYRKELPEGKLRQTVSMNLGNIIMMSVTENDEFFNKYIDWLKDFRKKTFQALVDLSSKA